MCVKPNSEGETLYAVPTTYVTRGGVSDSRKVLWKSVSALMASHYGGENLTRLAKDCGFGPATSSRLKEAKTSVGIEVIDKIAKHFHVQAWELLVPGFDPGNRPTLQPLTEQERKLHERLREIAKELKETPQ
jgi:transcriptional regulator with XRE-family HTH domain